MQTDLRREMGVFDSVMLIVGSTIGVGIFVTTGLVAGHVAAPGFILLAWLLGGLLALAGALSCAELSAMFPRAGGDYVYLREAYGPLLGFLSGWASFFVTFSGSIASLALGLTAYLAFYFPVLGPTHSLGSVELLGWTVSVSLAQASAVGLIALLSLVQVLGVRQGSNLQNVLSVAKVGALILIVLLAFAMGDGKIGNFFPLLDLGGAHHWSSLGVAFIPIVFTYAGWNSIVYLAAEVKDPGRTVPQALLRANLLIIVLYVGVNAAFIYGVPVEKMQGQIKAAEIATSSLFGYDTAAWLNAIIGVSILGALNAIIMTGPRIYYAMAQDQLFFRGLSQVHPRFHTPARAIALQGIWACVLVLTGTFATLLTYVSVIIVVFSALTVAAVVLCRIRQPGTHRPYRVRAYPWIPGAFVVAYGVIALSTLSARPTESFWGAIIVSLGIPAYFFWKNSLHLGSRRS